MAQTETLQQFAHPWDPDGSGSVTAANLETWVKERLDRHRQAIDALIAVEGGRTVENTLRPYDDLIAELGAAGSQTGLLNSVATDKAVRDSAQALTQQIAEAGIALGLNRDVYSALSAIDLTGSNDATRHYLDRTLLQYRLAGVDKDEATRSRVRQLQDKVTELSLTFARNVQEGGNRVTISSAAELDGLPEDFIASHQPGDDGTITLTTDYPDFLPVMTFAKSAGLRRSMFLAYNTRAYPANRQVLLDLLATRREIATTLGFETWADLATADQMMESAANMRGFLAELDKATLAGAEREYAAVIEFARARGPELEQLAASDRAYWYEQYRRSEFDFDSQSVRPYFPYARVEKGVLEIAEKLFKVTFRPAEDATVWHKSVSAWDVFDGVQTTACGRLGRFYLDMHPREGKDKWFSAHPLIPGICDRQVPQAALICNFPGCAKDGPGSIKDDPGLMQYSDVVTFFHEFGHLMHAILGGQQPWAGISGIATEGDFVEVPSQTLEEFFRDPRLLASFAHHYETNEPIPAELVLKMNRAAAFGRADWVRSQLFYTSYSLDTHAEDPAALDPDALLKADYARFVPYEWIDGNRMYASFTHLTGYSSNYYTYLYDKVIALDFFSTFSRTDLLNDAVSIRYRQTVLEPGGSLPGKEIVLRFLGRSQSIDAFQKWVSEEFQQAAAAVYD